MGGYYWWAFVLAAYTGLFVYGCMVIYACNFTGVVKAYKKKEQ